MANKFNPQGRSKYLWVQTIANAAAPTAAELTAGADLTCAILPDGVEGFANEPTTVDATALCDTAEQTVPGLSSTTNGAFTMHRASKAADTGSILFDDLADDVAAHVQGYVVFVPDGTIAAGELVDVFPSEIASINAMPAAGGQTARYKVGFSHPTAFKLNKQIVAS